MRVTPPSPAAQLGSSRPVSGNGGLFLVFFWKEVVNSSFTAPRWDSFANALFNQEQGDHRDGLCGREPGSQGSLWREAVAARSEGPLPWAVSVKAIPATPLLLPPQVQVPRLGHLPPGPSLAFRACF